MVPDKLLFAAWKSTNGNPQNAAGIVPVMPPLYEISRVSSAVKHDGMVPDKELLERINSTKCVLVQSDDGIDPVRPTLFWRLSASKYVRLLNEGIEPSKLIADDMIMEMT